MGMQLPDWVGTMFLVMNGAKWLNGTVLSYAARSSVCMP